MAIFTFVLVFLYPRYASNQLNGGLFEVTLITSLFAIFLFGFSGVFYLEVIGGVNTSIARKKVLARRGNSIFVLSLLLGTAMPALILFMLSINTVAVIAMVLWVIYAGFVIQQAQKLRTT